MKIRASSFLKNIFLVVVGMVKAKTMALKSKTSGFKTRLLVLGLLHNKKVLMKAINHKIHALISSQAKGQGDDAHFAEERNKAIMAYPSSQVDDDAEPTSPSHITEPAGYSDYDDDDDNYPDLRHSLFKLEDEDDEEEIELGDANGSVIEFVRNAKEEGGTEFSLEDEIDHVADVFIKRFRKQIKLQKLESFKRVFRLASMAGRAFFLALRRAVCFPPRSLSLPGASPLPRLRPLLAAVPAGCSARLRPAGSGLRCFSTRPTTSSLNDPSPNWSNRPPKETILLDGCDFEHWLVVVEPPDPSLTRDEIIDSYIKTLAEVLGSEEEARMSIYSVSTKHYFAFGCKVSEEISYKIKPLSKVRWVLPDSYLDVKNKDYGGEPFIDGKAVPYDPKYHEEWVRNNARAQERSRRNDRPRNFDRSRNFERRRENMQNFQNREAPPVQNQEFQNIPSQNTAQHTFQAPPPGRDGTATPNFQSQMPPNAHSQQGGYVPNYQGGSQGFQRGPGGPGYQSDQGYQGGFSPNNAPGGGLDSGGSGTGYPVNNVTRPPTGSSPGYPRGNPAGPPTGYQVNYQGGSSARPGPDTGYQGGNPSGYQGGSSMPTNTYPGGYQGGAPAYQGGNPSGHQGFNQQPYQGQGVASGYQHPNSRYQGGNQNNQQGGEGYQGGAPVYPGRDLPGRDQ
ncbi:hypothetical protein ZIOFF_019446 [Zingiber officinale]|uniref:MORF/ORRM1/DAG-like MORF domain-containing protein n=2 Tax=Zingiber officinale TaxID=94328 RepID=A0A8J5H9J0_ZINOF|nr:hypothetical protein ZIOFF_019446 [Zingiber officinale]